MKLIPANEYRKLIEQGRATAAAIVAVNEDAGEYRITPLFVSVTPEMDLTDHDGVPAGGVS